MAASAVTAEFHRAAQTAGLAGRLRSLAEETRSFGYSAFVAQDRHAGISAGGGTATSRRAAGALTEGATGRKGRRRQFGASILIDGS